MLKMNKIIVTSPKKENNKWSIYWGKGSPRLRNSANLVFNALQRRYLRLSPTKKTSIMVKMADGTNETCSSTNISYLLWTTRCFIEDYLSRETKNKIDKKIYE